VAGDHALHRLAQVLPQVKPVGDLHRVRCPKPGALGVGAGAVPADHLHARMRRQPVGQRLRLTARQQLHRLAGLAVDQHGPIDLPAAQREVVYSKHPRGGRLGVRQGQQQPQHGRPAGLGLQLPGEPGASAAGQRHRDLLQ
jgi:hypothetical protein